MNNEHLQSYRQAAVTSFAVIGFITLLALGVWGAVYSSRFVPGIVGNLGTAAVYLGSAFTPTPAPTDLSVVPTASSTVISFGTPVATTTTPVATTTKPIATTTRPVTPPKKPTPVVVAVPVAPHGLPDLAISVQAIGYLTTESTSSFVPSPTVPDNMRPAIKFFVKNVGTNVSGTWRFSAEIPTKTDYTYRSDAQQSLAPGDYVEYVFGFDRAKTGNDQPIEIVANYDNAITESSTTNNTLIQNFTIL